MRFTSIPSDASLPPLPPPAAGSAPASYGTAAAAATARATTEQEALVLQHLPEVRLIARNILRRLPASVQLEDLVQAGSLGLIDAARRYGPRHNVPFRQYARIRISGAIFDSLRELDWASRYFRTRQQKLENAVRELESRLGRRPDSNEVAERLGMDLNSFYEFAQAVQSLQEVDFEAQEESERPGIQESLCDDPEKRPDALCHRKQARRQMRQCLRQLPREEARVLLLYYFKDWTMAQIARSIGKTESRVSQLHSKAVEHLRQRLGPQARHLLARSL